MSTPIPDPLDPRQWLMPAELMTLHNVHTEQLCAGEACPIHNPSDHHMKDWPLTWRGIMVRACPHGRLHPDPDSVRWHIREGHMDLLHVRHALGQTDCDGCCDPDEFRDLIADTALES